MIKSMPYISWWLTIDLAIYATNLYSATIVSSGLLRVFGRQVAELPLVAIRMCGYKCDGS